MQLTKHTDYAFRVLIYLANMPQEQTTIKEITERYNISQTHLMKVVNELSKAGWVSSTRGKGGGIKLGVSPQYISVKDVVMRMEKTLVPVDCKKPLCYVDGACKLQGVLLDAQASYFEYLAQYSLADLVWDKTQNLIAQKVEAEEEAIKWAQTETDS